MATSKSSGIPVDELVKKLLVDGETPEGLQSMYGFVAPNDSDDHITLYLDIHLQRSLSIRKEDIMHDMKISKTHNPLGGTLLWVKNGASYIHYGSMEAKEKAEEEMEKYLQGSIYQNHMTQGQTTEEDSDATE